MDLESAVADVYRGSLEDFVRRRGALVKELRAAGRREDATAVKGLRKPSRLAWALDLAVLDGTGAIAGLDTAVAATLAAQAAGGDVRSAISGLRTAVRAFAGSAARAAAGAGHALDEAALASAMLAVLGRTDALDALRRGCLAEVPEAGGLDFLASLPAPPPVAAPVRPEAARAPTSRSAAPRAVPVEASGHDAVDERAQAADAARKRERAALEAAAGEAVRAADEALAAARERSAGTRRTVHETEAKLEAAEEHLRLAELEVRALRGQRERARDEAGKATAFMIEAQQAAAEAQARLEKLAEEADR